MNIVKKISSIILILLLASCGGTKKITCSDGQDYIISKIGNKNVLNEIKYTVTKLTKSLKSIDSSNFEYGKLVDSLSLLAYQYKDSAIGKVNSSFLMYNTSPCDASIRNEYFKAISNINYRNQNFAILGDKIDSAKDVAFAFTSLNEILAILNRVSPPAITEFPTVNKEYILSDAAILEKSLVETLNKHHFNSETIVKDGITFTKTDYTDLKIPNYRNKGLIALLISRAYQSGNFSKYRIQYIIKKQYSTASELQDADQVIEDFTETFLDNFTKELSK